MDKDVIVSGSTDRTVRIWDIDSGSCLNVLKSHSSTIRCLVVLPYTFNSSTQSSLSAHFFTPKLAKGPETQKSNVRWLQMTRPQIHALIQSCKEEAESKADNCGAEKAPLSSDSNAPETLPVRVESFLIVSGSRDKTLKIWHLELIRLPDDLINETETQDRKQASRPGTAEASTTRLNKKQPSTSNRQRAISDTQANARRRSANRAGNRNRHSNASRLPLQQQANQQADPFRERLAIAYRYFIHSRHMLTPAERRQLVPWLRDWLTNPQMNTNDLFADAPPIVRHLIGTSVNIQGIDLVERLENRTGSTDDGVDAGGNTEGADTERSNTDSTEPSSFPGPPIQSRYVSRVTLLQTLEGHTDSVRAIAASRDAIISGSYDTTIRIWSTRPESLGACLHQLSGHTSKVYSIAADESGYRACSGSMDNTVRVWDCITGHCLYVLEGKFYSIYFYPWKDFRILD
jgi:WD40 repeat protein